MLTILIGMAAIILLGIFWRTMLRQRPADAIRGHLARAVYEVFLPALVLHVMWRTDISLDTLRVPVVSAIGVLISLLAAYLIYGDGKKFGGKKAAGAMLLAAGFGNYTYLGLPVLTQTFGEWSQAVAIPYDLFASTPLLFTVGIMLAGHYGSAAKAAHPGVELLRVPALWAAVGGLMFSVFEMPIPDWLDQMLGVLGAAVVPLMLLSIGMALRWQSGWASRLPVLAPVILIQLLFMPLVVWAACIGVGMPEKLLAPTVIEGAMPCMVLGLVICDRFKLDASLYAEAVTITTGLSLLTLPLWLKLVV
ncbi:MAG: AEC family transporter [Mariprofundaceae bacterium]